MTITYNFLLYGTKTEIFKETRAMEFKYVIDNTELLDSIATYLYEEKFKHDQNDSYKTGWVTGYINAINDCNIEPEEILDKDTLKELFYQSAYEEFLEIYE